MKVAILTTDNREHHRTYDEAVPRFGPAIEALLQGLAGLPELEVHVISCTQRPMHAPEKLSENTWFHLLEVPKIGWLRTGYQGCVRAIRKQVRELDPDLVHGQGTERECALGAVFSGFPSVVTIHGNTGQVARSLNARIGSYLWCTARLESYALRRAAAVFCNSAYTEQVVRKSNLHTWRVPNALRLAFFDTPLPPRPSLPFPILLNVGSVLPYKRQSELLEIARRLSRKGQRFKVLFVGGAEARNSYASGLRQRIADFECAEIAGEKNLTELIRLYDSGSALVHIPSEEAFGLVAAEALSRNLKLFGTRVGGLPDIAAGVEGAELFPNGDDAAIEGAIDRWLQEGCTRPATAAAEMRKRYHPDVIARRHLKIYREISSRK